ncbi:hypothetical protein ACLQ3C_17860 [Gordonia sp. DT30]|uniref:hypothetical protein n=1 Tax=Gordonia sp. DT30 TaxID=3416546 RepID=UPI003CE6A3EB
MPVPAAHHTAARGTSEHAAAQQHRPERLTTDDDLFVRMEHALGVGVINQAVWRLDGRLSAENFAGLADRLRQGRLSRVVRRRPAPCRDTWHYTEAAGTDVFESAPVGEGAATAWAQHQADRGVDSVRGPAWRLSAAYSADGRATYVSLIVAHAVGDGWSVVTAVEEAVRGTEFDTRIDRSRWIDDIADGMRTATAAALAAARLTVAALRSRRDGRTAAPTTATGDPVQTTGADTATAASADQTPSVLLTIAADEFIAVADRTNGTPNALFVGIMVGLLERAGLVSPGDVVPVSLPVSMHPDGDRKANATTGTSAAIEISDGRYLDLTPIRAACRSAYGGVADRTSTLGHLSIVAQALGDGLVRRLAANQSTPLCLASNLGQLSADFTGLGSGVDATVAVRAVTDSSPAELASLGGGISGWFCLGPETAGLAVTSLDPGRIPDQQSLSTLIRDELKNWRLNGRSWGA